MYIHEAVTLAMKGGSGKMIARRRKGKTHAAIIPTNSYEACLLSIIRDEKTIRTSRQWNPKPEDLIADDWEIVENETENYKGALLKRDSKKRDMYIHEAVKKALDEKGKISRSSVQKPESDIYSLISMTELRNICLLETVTNYKHVDKTQKWWSPTADDLMADDWTVVTE